MKKLIVTLATILTLTSFATFAEQVSFEEFYFRVQKEYGTYVTQEVYEYWNGDADYFINYLKVNGQCYSKEGVDEVQELENILNESSR